MYYTDIGNPELQYFRENLYAPNFSISLSNILESNFFKVDTVVEDKIYRICPLFNTKIIKSSNSLDKIIEDKLIIAQRNDEETHYTFISDENGEIEDYTDRDIGYAIGDNLSVDEFNGIVYYLLKNTIHTDNFLIDDLITGKYGTYEFDIGDFRFMDTGILIGSENNFTNPRVKLTNNVFKNTTYTLSLNILHYTDVNILDDIPTSDFKVVETITVELEPDNWVEIPLNDFENGYIIDYNVSVSIPHLNPFIKHLLQRLLLSSNHDIVESGDGFSLSVFAEDIDGTGFANQPIRFVQKNQPFYFTWYNASDYITVTEDSSGTTFANNTSDNRWIWANQIGTSSDAYDWTSPFVIEFDVVSRTGENTIIYGGTTNSNIYRNFYQLAITGNNHIRIVGMEDMVYFYTDDELKYSASKDSAKARFGFRISPNESFKFKNLKITGDKPVYPLGEILLEDNGTTSSYNDIWTVSNGTLTRNATYSELAISSGNTMASMNFNFTPTPFVMEFDIKTGQSDDWVATLRSTGTIKIGMSLADFNLAVDEWHHIRVVYTGTDVIWADNENIIIKQATTSDFNRFQIDARNSSYAQMKNFKMYAIADNPTTDVNGIATCNIVGDGTGEKEYIATSDGVESNTAKVIDGVFVDKGTIIDNRNWYTVSANMEMTRNSEYTTLKRISNPTTFGWINLFFPLADNFAIEFDAQMFSTVNQTLITFRNSGSIKLSITKNWAWSDGKWHHTKLEFNGSRVKATVDGEAKSDLTLSGDANVLQFEAREDSVFNFKNFVIYPIESETPTPTPSTITLSTNKNILSAYDSETATLTANVKDSNNQGITGQTVEIYKGNTKLGNATDNNDGTYSYTYNANGDGDIVLTAQCSGLTSSAVNIEDCLYYKADEVSYVSSYTSGDHSIRLDNNLSIPITTNFEFSMDCKSNINGSRLQLSSISGASSSTSNYGFGFNRDGTAMNLYYRTTSSSGWGSNIAYDTNYHNVKFVRSGDTFTGYWDNTSKGTQTFTWWNDKSPFSLYWWVWKNGTISAKNIKIKKL